MSNAVHQPQSEEQDKPATCPECEGHGIALYESGERTCDTCGGTGVLQHRAVVCPCGCHDASERPNIVDCNCTGLAPQPPQGESAGEQECWRCGAVGSELHDFSKGVHGTSAPQPEKPERCQCLGCGAGMGAAGFVILPGDKTYRGVWVCDNRTCERYGLVSIYKGAQ